MTLTNATHQSDALILAVDESTLALGAELIRLASTGGESSGGGATLDWPMRVVGAPGEALRQIHQIEPGALFVCVARFRLELAAMLIDAVRQRRPQLPQLAVAGEHDEAVERAVRTAGAAYYFALGCADDESLLKQTLDALGLLPIVQAAHSGLSPPPPKRKPPRFPSVRL